MNEQQSPCARRPAKQSIVVTLCVNSQPSVGVIMILIIVFATSRVGAQIVTSPVGVTDSFTSIVDSAPIEPKSTPPQSLDLTLDDSTGLECLTSKHKNTGFIDFNTYWDTRDSVVTTLNAGAKLPNNFEYFQFVNFDSPFGSGSHNWTDFYSEFNLRRRVSADGHFKHLDWTFQYADGSTARDVYRFGIKWRFRDTTGCVGRFFKDVLKLNYAIGFHLIETDGSGWQMEHTYRRTFFDKRVYVSGFADHNIENQSRSSSWVTEHQIGVRLRGNWHAIAEYRYRSFGPPAYKSGWGIGLEYVMRFK